MSASVAFLINLVPDLLPSSLSPSFFSAHLLKARRGGCESTTVCSISTSQYHAFLENGFQIEISSRSSVCPPPTPVLVSPPLSSSDLHCDFNFATIC